MNVYPQDLGKQLEEKILRHRAPDYDQKPLLSVQTSAILFFVSLAGTVIAGLLGWIIGIPLLFVTIIAASVYLSAVLRSPSWKQLTECISDYEISFLRDQNLDTLLQDYFVLVRTILSVPPPQTEAEKEICRAVYALGTAIESLPAQARQMASDNPQRLRAESGRLEAEAQSETDPVVRASRQRRADTLMRRAETASQTAMLLRRHQALREEVAEQINALRTNLNALQVGTQQSVYDLVSLAASIQSVTAEANAITAARAEINTLLSNPTIEVFKIGETLPLRNNTSRQN